MKTFLSLVIASLVVAGSAIGLHARRESQGAALQIERQAETIEELSRKLESLGERLANVERSGGEARIAVRRAVLSPEPEARKPAEAAAESAEPGSEEESDGGAQAFARQLVAALGTEGESQMRDYVRQVYLDERDSRREREAAEAEEQRKEFEELGKGPYGKLNRRVNTLGKRLAMDDRQKQRYHDLLASYHARLSEMRKAIDPKDQSSREQYRDDEQALQGELDAHVARLLNQQQAEEYAAMHAIEKSVAAAEGGAVIFKFREAVAGGMAIQEDILGPPVEEAVIDLGIKVQQKQEAAARAAAAKLEQIRLAPPAGK